MKNLYATTTILLVAVLQSSIAFSAGLSKGVPTSGGQATQQILRALGKDVLFGLTPQNQPCVVEVVFPNQYHSNTEVRVYLGKELDDVPEQAAWISINPTDKVQAAMVPQGLNVRVVEQRPDEEGVTTIAAQLSVLRDPARLGKWVVVKTNASYISNYDVTMNKPARISKMACLIRQ
jgi:hypothetical protein